MTNAGFKATNGQINKNQPYFYDACEQPNVVAVEAKPAADGFVIALISQYKALNNALQNNQFKRPLVLQSSESPRSSSSFSPHKKPYCI